MSVSNPVTVKLSLNPVSAAPKAELIEGIRYLNGYKFISRGETAQYTPEDKNVIKNIWQQTKVLQAKNITNAVYLEDIEEANKALTALSDKVDAGEKVGSKDILELVEKLRNLTPIIVENQRELMEGLKRQLPDIERGSFIERGSLRTLKLMHDTAYDLNFGTRVPNLQSNSSSGITPQRVVTPIQTPQSALAPMPAPRARHNAGTDLIAKMRRDIDTFMRGYFSNMQKAGLPARLNGPYDLKMLEGMMATSSSSNTSSSVSEADLKELEGMRLSPNSDTSQGSEAELDGMRAMSPSSDTSEEADLKELDANSDTQLQGGWKPKNKIEVAAWEINRLIDDDGIISHPSPRGLEYAQRIKRYFVEADFKVGQESMQEILQAYNKVLKDGSVTDPEYFNVIRSWYKILNDMLLIGGNAVFSKLPKQFEPDMAEDLLSNAWHDMADPKPQGLYSVHFDRETRLTLSKFDENGAFQQWSFNFSRTMTVCVFEIDAVWDSEKSFSEIKKLIDIDNFHKVELIN